MDFCGNYSKKTGRLLLGEMGEWLKPIQMGIIFGISDWLE